MPTPVHKVALKLAGPYAKVAGPLLRFALIVGIATSLIIAGSLVIVFMQSAGAEVERQEAALADCGTAPNGTTTGSTSTQNSGIPGQFAKAFGEAGRSQGVEPELLSAVFWEINGQKYPDPPAPYGKGDAWPSTGRGAAGPFQRTPSEWSTYGVDANRDGKADVSDLIDAAYGTAAQLAALGAKAGTPLGDASQTATRGTVANALAQFRAGSEGDLTGTDATNFVGAVLVEYDKLKATAPAAAPAAASPYADVPLKEKILQTFIVGIDAGMDKTAVKGVASLGIGGIYIVGTKDAVADGFTKAFFDELGTLAGKPLTIAVDQEGGLVQIMATDPELPSAKKMGSMNGVDLQNLAAKVAKALAANGVTMNLSPVLDIDSGRSSDEGDIIGGKERSFGSDAKIVGEKATAVASVMSANGVVPVFKHFPGLRTKAGGNNTDIAQFASVHIDELRGRDIEPYRYALKTLPDAAVMLSNVNVTGLDAGQPASVSPAVVSLLRDDLKFGGTITTDDLNVPSVIGQVGDLPTAVVKALAAGVDRPLFGRLPQTSTAEAVATVQGVVDAVTQAVNSGTISLTNIDAAYAKVMKMKGLGQPAATGAPVDQPINQPGATAGQPAQCCKSATLGDMRTAAYSTKGDNNAVLAYNYFNGKVLPQEFWADPNVEQRITPEQAAGFPGNMVYESGVEPMTLQGVYDRQVPAEEITSTDGGPGWGLVQQTPWGKMVNPLTEAGKDPNDFYVQLDFTWEQLTGTGIGAKVPEKNALREILKTNTPEAAAKAFAKYYERYFVGEPTGEKLQSLNDRMAAARAIYDNVTVGTPIPTEIKERISTSAVGKAPANQPAQNPAPANAQAASVDQPVGAKTVIALDPGHGGELEYVDDENYPGGFNSGLKDRETNNNPEGTDVLEIAHNVKDALEAAGYTVVLLRDDTDPEVPSKVKRVREALDAHADLAVSIHTTPGNEGTNEVWPQRMHAYREFNGHRLEITNQAVADLSLKYAQAVATARAAAEGHQVDLDDGLGTATGSFTGPRVFSQGNASLVQLWGQDIPWIYSELTQDGPPESGITSDELKGKYTQGLINGIKAAIPPTKTGAAAGAIQAAITSTDKSCTNAAGTLAVSNVANVSYAPASNCNAAGNTTRQRVVCIAQGELAKWDSGEIQPGTGYHVYSQGNSENWCADFASWVYWQANYPIGSAFNWRVPLVDNIKITGEAGGKFIYTPDAGYTPVPGDLVIRKEGMSHVNIVIAVEGNTLITIGGNQVGDHFTQSVVSTQTDNGFTGAGITGYVSPTG